MRLAIALGWAVTALVLAPTAGDLGGPLATGALGLLTGLVAGTATRPVGPVLLLAPAAAVLVTGTVLVVPVDGTAAVAFAVGLAAAGSVGRVRVGVVAVGSAAAALTVGTMAGAWSVDEPAPSDPRMVAGAGVVVSRDTHAFLIRQGATILRHDGETAVADFLSRTDPTSPGGGETYLWRVQLGSRDADRVLKKTEMPDHFFNWWTHSGKGLVAGPSGATYAEQQFARAVRAWQAGDRAAAMYRLGAATHLVDDACAPPHELFLVPHHRAYEEWVLARQDTLAVDRGGIYAADFRQRTGHGGPEWSSAHTRGWVDECSHRAAEFVLNTVQTPSDGPGDPNPPAGADGHFRDTQRLTAGYLAFFFDTVGGP